MYLEWDWSTRWHLGLHYKFHQPDTLLTAGFSEIELLAGDDDGFKLHWPAKIWLGAAQGESVIHIPTQISSRKQPRICPYPTEHSLACRPFTTITLRTTTATFASMDSLDAVQILQRHQSINETMLVSDRHVKSSLFQIIGRIEFYYFLPYWSYRYTHNQICIWVCIVSIGRFEANLIH